MMIRCLPPIFGMAWCGTPYSLSRATLDPSSDMRVVASGGSQWTEHSMIRTGTSTGTTAGS
eukprot:scaffold40386_cov252-Amphora_coffeaeformis.AAC.2